MRLLKSYRSDPGNQSEVEFALRKPLAALCAPCGVETDPPIAVMFPLNRLDDAVDAQCMALVLKDGTVVRGSAYYKLVGRSAKTSR